MEARNVEDVQEKNWQSTDIPGRFAGYESQLEWRLQSDQ